MLGAGALVLSREGIGLARRSQAVDDWSGLPAMHVWFGGFHYSAMHHFGHQSCRLLRMSFEIDIGFTSLAGAKADNEDFAGAMLPEPGLEGMGVIAAIADGVSAGGMGKEAAQTTIVSLVRDYYSTPQTWDTTVALDRIIDAQNSWLAELLARSRSEPLSLRIPAPPPV